ncbi:MAG: hypothetical protein N2515_02980 [Deltaproteobacteria bacterium]|nr:hypothetical protein [Deltaproteobacteria bacterium]
MQPAFRRFLVVLGKSGALAVVGGSLLVAIAWVALKGYEAEGPVLRGLKLGATVSEVKKARGEEGWEVGLERSGDLVLSRPDERYVFHEGVLVLIELRLPKEAPEAQGPEQWISPSSALVRKQTGDGVRVIWVSRWCPTHADYAKTLAGHN